MSVTKSLFGKLNEEEIFFYTITNKSGASVTLQTLGAGVHSICVPDKNGALADVVLGFDNPGDYVNPDYGYQGLTVGRWANRIRDGKFTFEGKEYTALQNQGTWTLHGGGRFSFTTWEAEVNGENSVIFSRFSPDGEDGFPGNMTFKVIYTFTDDNTLRIDYCITSDKNTVANPTNHTYFNLSGNDGETVENHWLMINADYFTETDSSQLATGELGEVKGTMMDFTTLHKIGDNIDVPFRACIGDVGYDNNYCLRNTEGRFELAAVLEHRESGRKMEVYTDLPGIQLYCGGWLSRNNTVGKGTSLVTYRRGVALETQFYPDALNIADFPLWTVKADEPFKTTTEFRFSTL
ncbi:MAG: galactose mutarotase [Ruminococcaceae bacterium]|nr:galactose mutarotase [Oscillospiraceae bacterium]